MELRPITPSGRAERPLTSMTSGRMASERAMWAPEAAPAAMMRLGSTPRIVWLWRSQSTAIWASTMASSGLDWCFEATRYSMATAKLVYFGKIDFGVGGKPLDNLLVLSFVHEGRGWKYDTAEFVNLNALPDVRKQLQTGDMKYVDGEAFLPDGKRPSQPIVVNRAKYIAKVYTYCPGREVRVSVNSISKHRFQDIQRSEIIIGGAKDGRNDIWYSIKDLPGYKGKDPLTIRVYLFSQINKVLPVKVFQYQVEKGKTPNPTGSSTFTVDAAASRRVLQGK